MNEREAHRGCRTNAHQTRQPNGDPARSLDSLSTPARGPASFVHSEQRESARGLNEVDQLQAEPLLVANYVQQIAPSIVVHDVPDRDEAKHLRKDVHPAPCAEGRIDEEQIGLGEMFEDTPQINDRERGDHGPALASIDTAVTPNRENKIDVSPAPVSMTVRISSSPTMCSIASYSCRSRYAPPHWSPFYGGGR